MNRQREPRNLEFPPAISLNTVHGEKGIEDTDASPHPSSGAALLISHCALQSFLQSRSLKSKTQYPHLGQLASRATGDLLHPQRGKLSLELGKLLQKVLLAPITKVPPSVPLFVMLMLSRSKRTWTGARRLGSWMKKRPFFLRIVRPMSRGMIQVVNAQ